MNHMKRHWLYGFAAVLALVMGAMPVAAFAQGATSGSGSNYSFYPTASAAAVYVDNMIAAGRVGQVQLDSVGEISGAAGFADLDVVDTTVSDWDTYIQSSTSRNTVSYTYDAYLGQMSSHGVNAAQRMVEYGRFGRLLSQLGLDETGDSGIIDGGRRLMGYVLQGTWYIANGADAVIQWCYDALQALNPFRFLANVSIGQGYQGDVGTIPDTKNGSTTSVTYERGWLAGADGSITGVTAPPALDTVLDFIAQIYNWCYRNAWIVILPVLVALVTFLLLVGNSRQRAWSLGKRILFIFVLVGLAVPVWGVAYTAVLESMSNVVDDNVGINADGVSPANRVVLSTLVDTAGWARTGFDTTGIGLKSTTETVNVGGTGGDVTVTTDQPATDSVNNLRTIVLNINKKTMGISGSNANGTLGAGEGDSATNSAALAFSDTDAFDNDGGREAAQALLTSYIEGDKYEAAQYESYVKGGEADAKAMATWLQATSNPEAYAEGLSQLRGNESSEEITLVDNGLLQGNAPTIANSVANNSELAELYEQLSSVNGDDANEQEIIDAIREILDQERNASDNDGEFDEGSSQSALETINWFGNTSSSGGGSDTSLNTLVPDGDLNPTYSGGEATWSGSLSAIGTYNFLNTRFDSNGFTVYSAAKSANTQSRVSHYSTSLGGGSVLGLLFGVNAIVLLIAFGITALVYGLSLLFSNLGRSAKMLVSLPAASLGMMGSIARVFIIACMMIVELIATGLCYVIMRGVLFALNEFMVGQLGTWVAGLFPTGATTLANALFTPLMLIISTVLLIIYIVMAIRLRGAITGSISEALTSLMNRLTGVSAKDTPSHAFGKIAQGALIGGALMGGAGGASGMAAGAAALGAAGYGLMNAGKGDTINGDSYMDANASESAIDNSQKTNNQSQHDGNTENKLDKNAGDTSLLGAQPGVEGAERQDGLGIVTGNVTGALSGIGVDSGMNDAMRMPAEDLGSANRLTTNEFGYDAQSGDEYADATSLDSAYADQMQADSVSADDVSNASLTAASMAEGGRSDATNFGDTAEGTGQMSTSGYDAYGTVAADSAEMASLYGANADVDASAEGRMDSETGDNIFAAQTSAESLVREGAPETAALTGAYGSATNFGDTVAGNGQMSADMNQAAYAYGGDVDSSATADADVEGANAELYGAYGDATNYGETAAGTGRMDAAGTNPYAVGYDATADGVDAYGQVSATGDITADGEMRDIYGEMGVNASLFGTEGTMQPMGDQSSLYDVHGDNAWQDVSMTADNRPVDTNNPELEAYTDAELGDVDAYGVGMDREVEGENAEMTNLFEADYGSEGMYGMGAEGIENDTRQVYGVEDDAMLGESYLGTDEYGAPQAGAAGVEGMREMRDVSPVTGAPQISVAGTDGTGDTYMSQSGSDFGRTPQVDVHGGTQAPSEPSLSGFGGYGGGAPQGGTGSTMSAAEMRAYERMGSGVLGGVMPGQNTFAESMHRETIGGAPSLGSSGIAGGSQSYGHTPYVQQPSHGGGLRGLNDPRLDARGVYGGAPGASSEGSSFSWDDYGSAHDDGEAARGIDVGGSRFGGVESRDA